MAEKQLTPADVQAMIDKIEAEKWDDETAHIREDGMLWTIIEAIATGNCRSRRACCEVALKSKNIDFSRWYA